MSHSLKEFLLTGKLGNLESNQPEREEIISKYGEPDSLNSHTFSDGSTSVLLIYGVAEFSYLDDKFYQTAVAVRRYRPGDNTDDFEIDWLPSISKTSPKEIANLLDIQGVAFEHKAEFDGGSDLVFEVQSSSIRIVFNEPKDVSQFGIPWINGIWYSPFANTN